MDGFFEQFMQMEHHFFSFVFIYMLAGAYTMDLIYTP